MLQVSDDFIQILACLFSNAWRIFVSFNIPGTNITVPELAFACLMILFVLRWVAPLLGIQSIRDEEEMGTKAGKLMSAKSDFRRGK